MFERIIIATDLSPASDAVVGCLGGLAAFGVRHVMLLQCLEMRHPTAEVLPYGTAVGASVLARQKERLMAQGFEVETRIVPGFAKVEINRIARDEDYGLIVVGSHGHSLLTEVLLGGVASEVIQSAIRPVLVVRVERDPASGEVCVLPAGCELAGNVLYATDFSDNAEQAFAIVEAIAAFARRITLLHVLDEHAEPIELAASDRERLATLQARLSGRSAAEVRVELRTGKPYQVIVATARECGTHLIVMGSQGRGFVPELFLGSVSHQVVRHAPAPVMLVPAAR